MNAYTYSFSIASVLIVVFIILARKNLPALLKDTSVLPLDQRSYSLSSTVTFYWTIIIIFSICYIGIVTNAVPEINGSVLILMGIAAATTTTAKVIDADQSANPAIARTQDTAASEGFLRDILSDSNGISVSRLQAVMFNIIYGCAFLATVFSKHVLDEFTAQTLGLLGVSAGAYALLKIPENTTATVTTAQPQQPVQPNQPQQPIQPQQPVQPNQSQNQPQQPNQAQQQNPPQ